MKARKAAAPVVSVLLLGSMLQTSQASAAPGLRIACKTASARALAVDERNRTIGQITQTLTFCWSYTRTPSNGLEITSAKINSVKMGMSKDVKPCGLSYTRSEMAWNKAYFRGLKTKVFKSSVRGTYERHVYVDTTPRDCKYKYYGTAVWRPQVTIWGEAGGKVKYSAPTVGRA